MQRVTMILSKTCFCNCASTNDSALKNFIYHLSMMHIICDSSGPSTRKKLHAAFSTYASAVNLDGIMHTT